MQDLLYNAPINICPNVVVQSQMPFGLLALPRAPVTPGNHFFAVLPPKRPQKVARKILKSFSFFFLSLSLSCQSSYSFFDERQRSFSPWRRFLLFSGRWKCHLEVRSGQCCIFYKWVVLRCSLLFFTRQLVKTLDSFHS